MGPALIVAGVCLLLEMLFAATELSVISCDRIALRKEVQEGRRAARLLEKFLTNKSRFLATTLVGTQLSVVVSTVTMTYALLQWAPERVELYLLAGLTPVTVVLGEIVPKALGQQYAEWMARRLVYPLWFAAKLFAPLTIPLTAVSGWVSRRLKVEEPKLVTKEELELLLKGSGSRDGGEITEGERTMISNIFEFTDMTVGDVMVPLSDVVALDEEADLDKVAHEIADKQYTRFPVYRERIDRIVGIVHAFDVLKAGNAEIKLGALGRAPIYVPKSQPALDLLVEMQRSRQGMAVVVDEYGGAVGIATIEDILEEVVGQIEDEYDVAPPAIRKEAEGVWRVNARTAVKEVNRLLRIDLPEGEDYETLAGLVLDRLRHIPREGESVRCGNVLVKVVRASERAVEEVQIRLGKAKGAR
jgi:CBS domain containing-hemolysin-like protein